jgi:hypothetical protein
MQLKIRYADGVRPSYAPPWTAALGVEVKVSKDVPEGKLQLWQDGEMVKEVDV